MSHWQYLPVAFSIILFTENNNKINKNKIEYFGIYAYMHYAYMVHCCNIALIARHMRPFQQKLDLFTQARIMRKLKFKNKL